MATTLKVTNKVLDTSVHKMTCAFGKYPSGNGFHKGIDLIPNSTSETPAVLAYADGTVIAVQNFSGTNYKNSTQACGTYVAIKHSDGSITRYQHMKYNSLVVKKGDKVKKGQKLGLYGRPTTGNSSGSHLHWDISFPTKKSGSYGSSYLGETRYYVDPLPYLTAEVKTNTSSKTTTTYPTKTVKVKTSLNIRNAPSGSKIVGSVKGGTKVTVYATDGNWSKISKDKDEWVSSLYLK